MMNKNSTEGIRLALVGCGAVTEKRYLPAAESVLGLSVTHLVDLDIDRARDLAEQYRVPRVAAEYHAILQDVDAVVIATPPSSHAPIAVDCLDNGVHVLCEKPLTNSYEAARTMIAAAQRSNAILSVAMIRRVGRSARLMKRFIELGVLGALERVEIREGGEFNWPLQTGHIFLDPSEGGVLRDTGTHVIDLALWLAGARDAKVTAYRDDSWGGVEANARVQLELATPLGVVPADIEVSFTRNLGSTLRVRGKEGSLDGPAVGGAEIVFRPRGDEDAPAVIRDGNGEARSRVEDFAFQLEEFVHAVLTGGRPPVPAAEVLPTVAIIDQCTASRGTEIRSWEAAPPPSTMAEVI